MYSTIRKTTGVTFMTCNDCGHTISMDKICEKPIQSAIDMLKHMAAHNASRAFAPVEPVLRQEREAGSLFKLASALGVPASANRVEAQISRQGSLLQNATSVEYSPDQLRLSEALLAL